MDEDEKIEMRWNQHRTKPSFGIMEEGKQTKGLHRAKVSRKGHGLGWMDGRAWKGDGMVIGHWPNCIWILNGMV